MTTRVMFSLPDQLINRMKVVIPAGERSHVLAKLLKKEIENRENTLYKHALKLEKNKALSKEMKTWEQIFGQDGLDDL